MREYWKKYWKNAAAAVFLTAAGVVFWLSGEMGGEPLPAVSSQTAGSAVLEGTVLEGVVHDGASFDGAASGNAELGGAASENPASENPMLGSSAYEDASLEGTKKAAAVSETEAMAPAFVVHVCGEVANPGIYELPAGSRIYEAVKAAGGFTENAAEESVNLASPIEDGVQIRIYSKEEAETLAAGAAPFDGFEASGEGKEPVVNLNTATKEELMTLSGIGESRAEDIIRYREENGGFQNIEDIMKVSGIKDAAFQKIKDRITV